MDCTRKHFPSMIMFFQAPAPHQDGFFTLESLSRWGNDGMCLHEMMLSLEGSQN